jgi:hypothetical protein
MAVKPESFFQAFKQTIMISSLAGLTQRIVILSQYLNKKIPWKADSWYLPVSAVQKDFGLDF